MSKEIYDITPFTTIDYPGQLACIVWFAGCNMRCIYCYNKEIVTGNGRISEVELLKFLQKRKNKLSGVVFSGGECTQYDSFLSLAKKVKELGYLIKVDTNGSNTNKIIAGIEGGLIDFISLDFKAKKENFQLITNSNLYENFIQTLRFLIEKKYNFEVRTTIHSDFLDENDIGQMSQILEQEGYEKNYYIQNFLLTGENFGCIDKPLSNFNPKKIKSNLNIVLRNF